MPTPRWYILFRRIRPASLARRSARSRAATPAPTSTAAPAVRARLLAWPCILMRDPFFELCEPLVHRPFDLRSRRAWLFRPNTRPVRANGFGRWVGIGWFRFDRELRREFRHLSKSYP